MIKSSVRYSISDRVRDMIEDNNQILLVLNRFHIPFGFGDRTVGDVCDENGIDTPTFLAVADLISGRRFSADGVKLPTLMAYLREAHSYILDFRLPDIRETLISAVHQPSLEDVAMHIIKFFDEYMEEVRTHMDYEDSVVFPYIEGLLDGNPGDGFHIADFASKHESVVSKLDELKDIFMQHYCMPNTRLLNRALFNISACGDDLVTHCEIENMLLVPAVEALERETRRAARDVVVARPMTRHTSLVTFMELNMMMWACYVVLMFCYDTNFLGDTHPVTIGLAILCLVGSAFIFIKQTRLASWGANIRMAIATVLVFWTFVEILGHIGLLDEIWVAPMEHVVEMCVLLAAFIGLGAYTLYASFRR